MILTTGNPKTLKGIDLGYYPAVLHLAPSDLSGVDLCVYASDACRELCLNTAGRGGIVKRGETSNAIQRARVRRARYYLDDRIGFDSEVSESIGYHARAADRASLTPCYRLDGTSDLGMGVRYARRFPMFQFYDYTKNIRRALAYAAGQYPANYHLTFSRSESNADDVARALLAGVNVAVVFRKALPATWGGRPVIDGDAHDLRFLDPRGVIVGLRAKGRAKRDVSGFVVDAVTP